MENLRNEKVIEDRKHVLKCLFRCRRASARATECPDSGPDNRSKFILVLNKAVPRLNKPVRTGTHRDVRGPSSEKKQQQENDVASLQVRWFIVVVVVNQQITFE
jgi:hypothetical protein